MKKLLASAIMACGILMLQGQGAKVLNAYNYMNDNELVKAKGEIDQAITHEKTMSDGKTWYYRGLIYEKIYKNSLAMKEGTEDLLYPELQAVKEGSVLTAVESFEKSIELGSRKINMSEVKGHHAEMSMWAYQEGVNYYNEKDFGDAAKYFETCFDIKKDYQQIDTMAAYNAGLAYKLAKNNTKAEELIKYCIETGYQVEQGYLDLLHMYKEAGDEEKYKSTLKEAREKLPNNQDIIQEEINVYLESQEYDKALVNLDQAIANDPSSKALIYARGIILDNQQSTLRAAGKEDEANEAYAKAEADYKKVVELDPEGFDGNYSLGALYYNRGAELLNEANNILDDAKYKVAKAAAEKQLTAALPYLEKAHALNAEDIDTMTSLKTIYARTNQTEKYDAMKEKLEN